MLPNLYITGLYDDTLDCDPGPGVFELNPMPNGDICVVKWSQTLVGISETIVAPGLRAYPNPSAGCITIDLQQPASDVSLEVTDVLGQLVGQQQFGYAQSFDIELPPSKGIYFVSITSGNAHKAVFKVVKE